MKKSPFLICTMLLSLALLTSCIGYRTPSGGGDTLESVSVTSPSDRETLGDTAPETVETTVETVETVETTVDTTADTSTDTTLDTTVPAETTNDFETADAVESGEPAESDKPADTDPPAAYTYTDFTPDEKKMFTDLLGEVIPFVPNNNYGVQEYTYENEVGLNFYTNDNTAADFDAYRRAFAAYTSEGSYEDEYGDTWYAYSKGDFYVELSFYTDSGTAFIDVYAYILTDTPDSYLYTDFTADEKQMFTDLLGEVIPFVPNNNYVVQEYTPENKVGLNFYTYGNTAADFHAYRQAFAEYTLEGTYEDEYGEMWYAYAKGDLYVDVAYYVTEDGDCIDVYAYILTGGSTPDESGGSETIPADVDLITNDGKGLPTGTEGVYKVDMNHATYVKDVTDQGYYLGGCPTVGSPAVLVIPVEFSDRTAASLGYDVNVIKNAFQKDGVNDYYSVYDYYALSSYGQLTLDITVSDEWFRPQYTSDYYENATMEYEGSTIAAGDQMILNEALAYLDSVMDLSKFDSDGNGTIDAVVMINTLSVSSDADFHWAYRYWNVYTDEQDNDFEYDGVSANDYIWASYGFLHEGFDTAGNVHYEDTNAVATYTYIHEFGHVLGADDYYDTAGVGEPMGGCDVMDGMQGDHNAYTKFNYGWIRESRLVTTDTSVTLSLADFATTGDTIILANNWDDALGAYQEYFIVAYYRGTGLNAYPAGYFERDGVVVYHVNASLYKEMYGEDVFYDVYFNNTDPSDEYGTVGNLIEYVLSDAGTYTYAVGDRLTAAVDRSGTPLAYTFTVDALTEEAATITFTKAA